MEEGNTFWPAVWWIAARGPSWLGQFDERLETCFWPVSSHVKSRLQQCLEN